MRLPLALHLPSSELFFGVLHTLIWLFLVLQVSAAVVVPLAQTLGGPVPVETRLQ